ncbi:MAG: PAS domain-containing protein [Lentisphaeria bacterium]
MHKWSTLLYIMLSRLLLLLVMLATGVAMVHFRADDIAFFVFIALAFLITIPYAVWMRHEARRTQSQDYQFVVDVVLITGFIHFTGGIESQLSLLYPLVILGAGIVSSGKLALQISILSIFGYATLILLEASGALIYRGTPPFPYADSIEVVQVLMLRVLIFAFFAAACSYLADRCFIQDKQLQRLRVIANSILDNVGVPLLAVYEDGQIMLANPAAAKMLGYSREELKGKQFEELFPKDAPALENDADSSKLWKMKRCDDSLISVTFQSTKGNFPAAVIGSLAENPRGVDLNIVTLRDMTDLLEHDDQARLSERQRTAVDMVTEMAHVVRNPLTAIRGAGELLDASLSSMFKEAGQLTEDDWETVRSMCEVIFEQTKALEKSTTSKLSRYFLSSSKKARFGLTGSIKHLFPEYRTRALSRRLLFRYIMMILVGP